MTYPKEIIKKVYRSLPSELAQIVGTQETSEINDKIAKTYNLSTEQRLKMGDEVTMRLLGLTPDKSFAENLKVRLKITPEVAQKITEEVKNRILSKVPEKILSAQETVRLKLEKTDGIIVTTLKTKGDTIKESERGVINNKVTVPTAPAIKASPPNLPVLEPDFAKETLMVKKNEVAYDAAPTAQSTEPLGKTAEPETKKEELKTPLPNYGYPPGKDPYREPLT